MSIISSAVGGELGVFITYRGRFVSSCTVYVSIRFYIIVGDKYIFGYSFTVFSNTFFGKVNLDGISVSVWNGCSQEEEKQMFTGQNGGDERSKGRVDEWKGHEKITQVHEH